MPSLKTNDSSSSLGHLTPSGPCCDSSHTDSSGPSTSQSFGSSGGIFSEDEPRSTRKEALFEGGGRQDRSSQGKDAIDDVNIGEESTKELQTLPKDKHAHLPGKIRQRASTSFSGLHNGLPYQKSDDVGLNGMGYLSNRRKASLSALDAHSRPDFVRFHQPVEEQALMLDEGTNETIKASRNTLKRTSFLVRLSMSLEGKARVITGDESSPPKSQAPALPTGDTQVRALRRSQSLIGLGETAKQGLSIPFPLSRPNGRSRDSRTWEFYCDSDARNSLSAKAEQDQSGSAAGAIGLLRSRNTNARVLHKNKRSSQPCKAEPAKRVKTGDRAPQKAKLSRTTSSLARLQTDNTQGKGNAKQGLASSINHCRPSPSGDSDKENWVPGTQETMRRERDSTASFVGIQQRRKVLHENQQMPSQGGGHGGKSDPFGNVSWVTGSRSPPKIYEDRNASDCHMDAKFGLSDEGSGNARGKEDLDCVQNLLSLSQGNWR